jgi:progressive ankylosis protein
MLYYPSARFIDCENDQTVETPTLTTRRIFLTWWPLAASWLLMGIELPVISVVISRLTNPEISLAAYGGVIFPLALLIESPIVMLLAASTALCKDWASFTKIRRFMMITSAALTILHLVIVLTPLYYILVRGILGVPEEIIEPARIGLIIMTPWTWSIAYRRFHQGVLIRFGHSKAVSIGTLIRMSADLTILGIGFVIGSIPGVVVATSAVALGVISEATYVGIVVRPVLKYELKLAPPIMPPLTMYTFFSFYIPLVMTSLLSLIVQPIGSAALSRMPQALESLAAWSVVTGLVFMMRSFGIAFNEVVVALLDEQRSAAKLWRFASIIILITSIIGLIITATPLSGFWFRTVSALPIELAQLAQLGIWITLPMPALAVLQSWYQGAILHSHNTRGITEAVLIYLLVNIITLSLGVKLGNITGLYVGLTSFVLSTVAQTAWLWYRSRGTIQAVHERDEVDIAIPPAEIIS